MDYVWVLPKNASFKVPIGAQVLAKFGSRIKIKDDDLNEYWVSPEEIIRPMHPTSIDGVEDMIFLGELQEFSILRNLQVRYENDLIYTYIGSILVAVNPYKSLPIYDKTQMVEYRKKRLGELPPHIFAVADHTYESMRLTSQKRCIVISGESGAGKTESTKLLLRYFAAIAQKLSGKERQILDSNPILEAFGNAKTMCNDNSSRFGKYISIWFNTDGSIHSAQIKQYLLEKSRIVSQNDGEQNYHIFYSILTGLSAEEKQRLKLKSVSHYNYLNKGRAKISPDIETNIERNIETIKSAMRILTFSEREIWRIFEIVATILHFGNIEFQSVSVSNIETVNIITEEEIQNICSLLQFSQKHLVDSLTKKTISAHDDNVVKFLSKQEAINSRDAFVKKIFENLFNFIVEKINQVLSENNKNVESYIGILDIFGFEAFQKNSFEQLCINYANEKLQQFFIAHVFKMEQELYSVEGINWKFVEYPDNQEILDLIENGPNSVLSIMNDTTKIPRATDQTMLEKLIELNSDNHFFLKPKYKSMEVFGIRHFAGIVLYDVKDFIEKNYDVCSLDIKRVIQSSKNEFLKEVFANDFEAESGGLPKKRMETLSLKFKSSLDLLMDELSECQPFFLRCIKPNEMKKPQKFDRMLCCQQLKYSGMTEVTKIREAGYPVRYDFVQFVQHYRALAPNTPPPHKANCKEVTMRICRRTFKNFSNAKYELGRTKIFLKHAEDLFLEAEKQKVLNFHAVVIQKYVRGWLVRRRLLKLKKAVNLAEKRWIKKQNKNKEFQSLLHLIVRLQAYCKGYLVRSLMKKKLEEARLKKHEIKGNESVDFKDFAKNYFQDKQSHRFSKKPLKNSLTHLIQSEHIIAAKAIWLTILRYTGNNSTPQGIESNVSVGAQLRECLQAINKLNVNAKSAVQSASHKADDTKKVNQLYENWLKTKTTNMQKMYFIIGHGIGQPKLRDEIYCQLCKVLTKNPSQKAAHRGWDLLSSCTGCFPPSDVFLKYLKAFIRQGHKKYISFCLFRLHRTIQNGPRTQSPSMTEFEAIVRQKPVNLNVYLKNGAMTSVKIDSATTAKEMLDMVAKNIKLTNYFGFSLVLIQEMRCLSLGDGSNFVLDAVSECEQYIMEIGGNLENMPWIFYLKKEMFAPWQLTSDEVSTNLVYHQIKEGILTGEYGFEDKDLSILIAQICYVEEGLMPPSALNEVINQYIPLYFRNFSPNDLETIKEQVKASYQMMFGKNEKSVKSVREEIIKHAASKWGVQFSRFFNAVGSIRNLKGVPYSYPEIPLMVGINSSEIFIIDESNEKHFIAKMKYLEILEVTRTEITEGQGYHLKIINYEGMEISLTFQTLFDNDFYKLLNKIMETLKNYSKFAMSIRNYKVKETSFLELQKGDLIYITENSCEGKAWAKGWNYRNGKSGNFLLDCVKILPTIEKPSDSIIKAIREVVLNGKKTCFPQFTERLKNYTLEFYAQKYFRTKDAMENETHGSKSTELWKYSSEELRQPLQAKLVNKSKEAKLATEVFNAILQYTDKNNGLSTEDKIVYKIFTPGLENNELRDETYCQLMKQLTSNINKESESKTWELMWMLTGLFACEDILANEVKKFLQSRRTNQIARECLTRFQKISTSDPRKHPPHSIEIEAVKNRPCYIFHRIYFPDNTHKFFQINSLTKFKELKEVILDRLNINSTKQEFCLCLQVLERIFLLPENYYMFDYLQIFRKWTDRNNISKWEYKICLMKHIWKDSVFGSDTVTVLKFVFPQEYNKYIQGHYEISLKDLIKLAGLLCKAQYFNTTTQQFQKTLQKLIPSKAVNLMKVENWMKEIQDSYKQHHLLSEEMCKIEFLKNLQKLSSSNVPYLAAIPETTTATNYMFYPVPANLRLID